MIWKPCSNFLSNVVTPYSPINSVQPDFTQSIQHHLIDWQIEQRGMRWLLRHCQCVRGHSQRVYCTHVIHRLKPCWMLCYWWRLNKWHQWWIANAQYVFSMDICKYRSISQFQLNIDSYAIYNQWTRYEKVLEILGRDITCIALLEVKLVPCIFHTLELIMNEEASVINLRSTDVLYIHYISHWVFSKIFAFYKKSFSNVFVDKNTFIGGRQ